MNEQIERDLLPSERTLWDGHICPVKLDRPSANTASTVDPPYRSGTIKSGQSVLVLQSGRQLLFDDEMGKVTQMAQQEMARCHIDS